MKRHIKQKVKPYLTRVSVRQMKKQHSETKRSVKRRKKENCNNGHLNNVASDIFKNTFKGKCNWIDSIFTYGRNNLDFVSCSNLVADNT